MSLTKLNTIGKRIAHARHERGMTQAELGRLVGKSKQLVSAAENDRSELLVSTATQIGQRLSIDLSWLLLGGPDPELAPLPKGRDVPLVTATEALRIANGKSKIGNSGETVRCPQNASDSAFALSMMDGAMTPSMLRRDLVIVDPEVTPQAQSIVLCVVFRSGGAKLRTPTLLIREYRPKNLDQGRPPFDLVPHHASHPIVQVHHRKDASILGVVTALTRIVRSET